MLLQRRAGGPFSVLLLGGAPATTQVYGSALARFVSPKGKLGAAQAAIVTPSGLWAQIADGFTYTDPATLGPAPAVSELDPALGPTKGNTKVTVVGIHLDSDALVFFDTTVAPAVKAVTGGIEAPPRSASPTPTGSSRSSAARSPTSRRSQRRRSTASRRPTVRRVAAPGQDHG